MHGGGSYDDWNGGTSYQATPALTLDLRYWNTDGHALGRDYRGRVVAAINVSPCRQHALQGASRGAALTGAIDARVACRTLIHASPPL